MLDPIILVISVLPISVFAACLGYACYTDVQKMTITNKTCLVGVGAFAAHIIIQSALAREVGILGALAVGSVVFFITALANARNVLGGGDVKLLTVVAFWSGPAHFMDIFFIIALGGGLTALLFLLKDRFTPSVAGGSAFIEPVHGVRPFPYGPAITFGGLLLCGELIVNALP